MRKTTQRPMDYLYTICHQAPYFHAGHVATGEQVLLGLQLPAMLAVFFDEEGKKLRVVEHAYSMDLEKRADGSFVVDEDIQERMEKDLKNWEAELKFKRGKIRVKQFNMPKHFVGIRDLPRSRFKTWLDAVF